MNGKNVCCLSQILNVHLHASVPNILVVNITCFLPSGPDLMTMPLTIPQEYISISSSISISSVGFPAGSAGKESTCSAEDLDLIPGLGRSPVEWNGYPLQYSGRENSMNCIVHGVAKSQTQLSHFHFSLSYHLYIYHVPILDYFQTGSSLQQCKACSSTYWESSHSPLSFKVPFFFFFLTPT